jgi:hypothetical protein
MHMTRCAIIAVSLAELTGFPITIERCLKMILLHKLWLADALYTGFQLNDNAVLVAVRVRPTAPPLYALFSFVTENLLARRGGYPTSRDME